MFIEHIETFAKDIDEILNNASEKHNWDLLTDKCSLRTYKFKNGKKISLFPQTGMINSLIEAYCPKHLDIIKDDLVYFGFFDDSSISSFFKRMHEKVKSTIDQLDLEEYMKQVDDFNIKYAKLFQSDHLKYTPYHHLFIKAKKPKHSKKDKYNMVMQQIQMCFTLYTYLFDGRIHLFFNGVMAFIKLTEADEKAKKLIFEGVYNEGDSSLEAVTKRNVASAYIKNVIMKHKIEPLASMISAGAGMREEQFVSIVIGLLVKPFINEPSDRLRNRDNVPEEEKKILRPYGNFIFPELLKSSYLRGLTTKAENYLSIANALTSVLVNKKLISKAGDLNKQITLLGKYSPLCTDENYTCGSVHFENYYIKSPKHLSRIQGMYHLVNGKDVLVPKVGEWEKVKHTTIKLRTPAKCNGVFEGKGLCKRCVGEILYEVNQFWAFRAESNEPNSIGTSFANILGVLIQHSILQIKHALTPNIKKPLYWIENGVTNDYTVNDPDGELRIDLKYSDTLFFSYKDVGIYPNKLDLLEPELMMMPYSNDLAYFSKKIRIEVGNKNYVIASDTMYYVPADKYEAGLANEYIHSLLENIGINMLYLIVEDIASYGKEDNKKTSKMIDPYDIDTWLNMVNHIDERYDVAFFSLLFRPLIVQKDTILPVDWSQENVEPMVTSLNNYLLKANNLPVKLSVGYLNKQLINPDNFVTEESIKRAKSLDIDYIIK